MTVLEWLQDRFPEVSPKTFYRGIFPEGDLEKKGEHKQNPDSHKYNGIIVAITGDKDAAGKRIIKRYTLTDELDAVDIAVNSDDFCLCSPLSYVGKSRKAENARMVYAIAIDVDKIRMKPDRITGEPEGLRDLYHQIYDSVKYLPVPTYMVSSGSGLHLYYLFEKPIPLFNNIAEELQALKRRLTTKIWDDYIVDIESRKDIQQEGIFQGFRMPGTITKNGGRAKAFLTGERVTIEYLNSFVEDLYQAKKAAKCKRTGQIPIEQAKELYSDWYEKRILNREPRKGIPFSRAVYDKWHERIKAEATSGHRYFCMMALAMFAQKCSYYDPKRNPNPVTREELERDSLALFDVMESKTTDADNHFSNDDILAALESFNEKWNNFPRSIIEYRTAITIQPQKRNYRKQKTHLEIMRSTENILYPDGEWRQGNGRKNKKEIVQEWRMINPDGNKADCIRETGLTRPTVKKWWDSEPEEEKKPVSLTLGDE